MAGLANRLGEKHRVTLLTLDRSDRDRYPVGSQVDRLGLDLIFHSRNRIFGATANLKRIRDVRQAISQRQPQVVLSFCDQMNIVVLAATRPLRIPTVVTEFTDPRHQKLAAPWSMLRRILYPTARVGVALNQSTLPIVRSWIRGPTAIISAAVDRPPEGFVRRKSPRNRLVNIGRLSPEKGFDRLVDAFAEVAGEFPQWDLHLAGDGVERENLQAQVRRLGLVDRVFFTGWIKDVWEFLATADAFALTSRYDGYPVALLEAMSAGLPVLSVDCDSGPREIIRHGWNGWLVANTHQGLCSGLKDFLANSELRDRMGQTATEVQERLSWQKFTDDYEAVLRQATESKIRKLVTLGHALIDRESAENFG
jgi:glycosyltransferase involved in cell wall biosynthesis